MKSIYDAAQSHSWRTLIPEMMCNPTIRIQPRHFFELKAHDMVSLQFKCTQAVPLILLQAAIACSVRALLGQRGNWNFGIDGQW